MLEPGTQVGRYEIQRQLSRGGMSRVYVAHDPVLGRLVAIKVISADLDSAEARSRFEGEARSAAALGNNQNIVTIYDFGEYESQPYIVMEYVQGETLLQTIRRKATVRLTDKLRWIEELCSGAAYAHSMSVVHRDIKPANLIIDRAGRLRILDFGIARLMGVASRTTALVGTPGYMAPEQIKGQLIDQRADLFSIGVVFYELLSYSEAFPGDSTASVTYRVLSEPPSPLAGLVQDVTPELQAVVERALEKDVDRRWQDAESLRAAVARIRRDYESGADTISHAPTLIRRDLTPPATGGRATGSSRHRAADGPIVAEMTPPPSSNRKSADPGALTRLRQAQIAAAVEESQTLLEQYELESALDACNRALALDPAYTPARELKVAIETAFAARDATMIAERPSADPGSAAPARRPSERYTPPAPEALPPSPAIPAPVAATIVVSDRPPTASSMADKAAAPPLSKPAAPKKATSNAAAQVMARMIAALAFVRQLGPAAGKLVVRPAKAPAASQTKPKTGRTTKWVWIGAAAGLTAAGVIAAVLFVANRPAPTGTVVIDAKPWGRVKTIKRLSDGEQLPPPADAFTPVLLPLETGSYEITLTGPDGSESEPKQVQIVENQSATEMVTFREVTPDEYFERYLAPAETLVDPGASDDGTVTVTAPSLSVTPGGAAK